MATSSSSLELEIAATSTYVRTCVDTLESSKGRRKYWKSCCRQAISNLQFYSIAINLSYHQLQPQDCYQIQVT
jgi:hypothetical protein